MKQTKQGKVLLLLFYRSTILFGIKMSSIWILWCCHTDPRPLLLLKFKFFSEFKNLQGKNAAYSFSRQVLLENILFQNQNHFLLSKAYNLQLSKKDAWHHKLIPHGHEWRSVCVELERDPYTDGAFSWAWYWQNGKNGECYSKDVDA